VTRRLVAVLVPQPGTGFPSESLRSAMVEDVYETVAALELVEPALVLDAHDPARDALESLTWPGTRVIHLSPGRAAPRTSQALGWLVEAGAEQATIIAGDAPDLPGLLVGKLHRALGSADVALLPSADGRLVGLACHVPLPGWLAAEPSAVDLDRTDAVALLQEVAPRRTSVSLGPGWHRVRTPADLDVLDPGLEGWEVTRALLAAQT
jgi:hypothetical protein